MNMMMILFCSSRKLVCAFVAVTTLLLITHSVVATINVDSVGLKKCNLYEGEWATVLDEHYPPYTSQECPFITQQFNCSGNGRPDLQYQKYGWMSSEHNCFFKWEPVDKLDLFGKVGGKRIMLVGDSLSMNQWQSFACIIYSASPNTSYQLTQTTDQLLSTIIFPDFSINLTLMYMRNELIVDIVKLENGSRVLKLDSVAASSSQWLQTDILIFGSWHWWLYTGIKQPWDLVQESNVMMNDMDIFVAYEKALKTWGTWVDQNVDTSRITIFFKSASPYHWNASTWGKPELQRCGGEQKPLDQLIEENNSTSVAADNILRNVLNSMESPINFLDISRLSLLRVDGHPSIYGNLSHDGMDCINWCLPGIPDTWNQLVVANLD